MKHSLLNRALFLLVGLLGKPLLATYFLTIRIRNDKASSSVLDHDASPAGVYAFWHAHQLAAVWHLRKSGAGILISASKDGEFIARVARAFGFRPARGSSSRMGASGLKQLLDLAAQGVPVAITPDGPRGPRYSIGKGALALAQKTGQPVTPFALGLSDFWELPSWDRFRVPKPFSKGVMMLGKPLPIPPDADEAEVERLGAQLRQQMLELEQAADAAARNQR